LNDRAALLVAGKRPQLAAVQIKRLSAPQLQAAEFSPGWCVIGVYPIDCAGTEPNLAALTRGVERSLQCPRVVRAPIAPGAMRLR
jgi:hypothetical protein